MTNLREELVYVLGAKGFWSRLYRSARAAWRCSRAANRAQLKEEAKALRF